MRPQRFVLLSEIPALGALTFLCQRAAMRYERPSIGDGPMNKIALFAALALSAAAVTGCKPDLLPGTNLEDTDENRAVLEFMGKYKLAVESRDAAKVLDLVAPDYFEDMGTVETDDDYGSEKLQRELADNFAKTKEIRLDLIIQKIEPKEDSAIVNVDYKYVQRALLDLPAGEKWVTHSDVNRLVLRRVGEDAKDGFLIVSGL